MVALGIADDEPDILRLFKLIMDRKGYPIAYMANNGEEAVEKNRQNPAEIIIMDYCMPFKDGVEALKEILLEFPATKIVLMTCGEDVSGMLNGFDEMVTIVKKPFSFKSMVKLLERKART
jgi:two-component system, chemotaxis family, chemotaxis protein CheY